MLALLVDFNLEGFFRQLLHNVTLLLKFDLVRRPDLAEKELSIEVEHDVFCDLLHVLVDVLVQQGVCLQLDPHFLIEILEQLRKARVLQIALLQKLVAHHSLSDLADEVIDAFDLKFELLLVVTRDLCFVDDVAGIVTFNPIALLLQGGAAEIHKLIITVH